MASKIATRRTVPPSEQTPAVLPLGLPHGALTRLACKCSSDDEADFLIKKDRIVCASCGHEVLCAPPVQGIFKATCACCISPSIKTTFILDSKSDYICTWCGVTR